MKLSDLSRRYIRGAYGVTRILVCVFTVLAVLLVLAFIFLRVYGVPGPLLREALRHVNNAGIPVEVEGITLTLHGWRADGVRYYSANPDDLDPLFTAQRVFFSVRNSRLRREGSDVFSLDVRAEQVDVNPSVEWGIAIPRDSPARSVKEIRSSLAFLPDRILISEGSVEWLDISILLDGTIIKDKETSARAPVRRQTTLLPSPVTEEQFLLLEHQLSRLSLPNGATVDIDFTVDARNYAASRIVLAARAEPMEYAGGGFSKVEVMGAYTFPSLQLERIAFFEDKQSLQLTGEYNLESGQAWGSLFNSITSNRLLELLPDRVQAIMKNGALEIRHLPRLTLDMGPAAPKQLLQHLSGAFSIRGLTYQGLEIESLRGKIMSAGSRIDLKELQGAVLGQESRAGEAGSAMHGGTASGTVFWDGEARTFGVDADADFDPNLLVKPLSFSPIATNVIRRFSFRDRPPQGRVTLGSSVDDWSSFYINIRATGNDVAFQGVEFSSINVVQTYTNSLLKLDPVAALQGSDFIKGFAWIDLSESTVTFDVISDVDPAALEDLVYPELHLFDTHIRTDGKVRTEARGVFDWKRMQQTDFMATVEAEQVDIPIARLDRFTAEVTGSGPTVTVSNAEFELYGGQGEGRFEFAWNPPEKELPYTTEFSFNGVAFRDALVYVFGDRPVEVSGTLEGRAAVSADFSTNFFATADGEGFVFVDKGQLTDLPLFTGFSRLIRRVFPAFAVFSITSLRGNFVLRDGAVLSEDAYFGGDVLSARGRGSYSPENGFDATIKAQVLREGRGISRMVQTLTDPLMKLLEMKLEGTLEDPSWQLEKF